MRSNVSKTFYSNLNSFNEDYTDFIAKYKVKIIQTLPIRWENQAIHGFLLANMKVKNFARRIMRVHYLKATWF